ncbi:D-alanyl-lipoteichoic acid biosynthesis protein DltB, partial [Streptococcus agalactiae]|nr:D-alanyl-lipoteichoic acid biosynthesis protein DltB [Streptococcus agalactiae]
MIQAFLEKLPHLDVYGNPQYFFYLILAVLPIYIGLFFKKRFALYEIIFSLS